MGCRHMGLTLGFVPVESAILLLPVYWLSKDVARDKLRIERLGPPSFKYYRKEHPLFS